MAFPNLYAHRKVAETSAKPCDICFKPSTSVLITPDNKDWFYVCPAHLKDAGFCTPKIDQAAVEARKKRELEEEIERVKKEYEEKQKKKKGKSTETEKKDGTDDKEDSKEDDKKSSEDNKNEDKTELASAVSMQSREDVQSTPIEEESRVFELKSVFYQQRLSRKRQAEITKRNRERMQDPSFFPSVPKNLPS
ncbi:VPS4-associated protein 1 [Madurella mycetomatis]|uniref:VPS4-associated protein 1 n=1 Tax=Madurella mycetomatis TaxID=100816 RepID=A0A175VVT7_9PEZI|nr:VPS4-associated protein 1 [Madurella mycetomatis]KXX79326.1 VPS4-associated protein 1 [Madurella mycetomatis]